MNDPDHDRLEWQPLSKSRLAQWSKLSTRKGRERSGHLIVEGVRQVTEALIANIPILGIVATEPDGIRSARRAIVQSARTDWPLFVADANSFEKLSDTVTSAGVVAIAEWSPRNADTLDATLHKRILFCDAITDPGNLGTLIRTGAGLGLDAIVVGEHSVEVTNPKVVRSTAGVIFRVPVFEHWPVEGFLAWCRSGDVPIVVADPAGDEELTGSLGDRWVAVVGGETGGLNPAWPVTGVARVQIRMHRGVESLNAAAAGAILIDRLCRQEEEGKP